MDPGSSSQIALPPYTEASSGALHSNLTSCSSTMSSAPPSSALGSNDFFDVAPSSDSTSFQVGYLGLKGFQAWLKGDVLVKLDAETKSRGRYTRCTVQLRANEQVSSVQQAADDTPSSSYAVELFAHQLELWNAETEPNSSTAAQPTVPSVMPFSFPLTEDLPHCIHLRHSSLNYTITAKLFSQDADKLPHAVKSIPVHLVRYTRPGALIQIESAEIDALLSDQEHQLQPFNWIEQTPTLVYAQINRTIFRRAEPIEIRIRIPPPDPTAVSEKGLKLRAVEADLVRIIHVKRHKPASADSQDACFVSQRIDGSASDPDTHEALLAHSGKLCRFHSQRPVLLRLTLHPPFDRANMPHPHPDHDALASGPVFGRGGGGGCESISQETLMHRVSFEVRIKIGIQGGRAERRDIILRRSVRILPGAAGALEQVNLDEMANLDALSEKERLKRSEKARMLSYDDNVGASSSQFVDNAFDLLDFGMDEEYDGYEDVGRSLDGVIDAAHGMDPTEGSSDSTDHAERLEQLRRFLEAADSSAHDDGPPPSLLESRNDLQVEVEVDGVDLAVPRLPHRHPADTYPDSNNGSEDGLLPPPPIDAVPSQRSDVSLHYTCLSMDSNDATTMILQPEEPPPPISPIVNRSEAVASDSHGGMCAGPGPSDMRIPVRRTQFDPASASSPQGDRFPLPLPHSGTTEIRAPYLDLPSASSSMTDMRQEFEPHPSYEDAMSTDASRLPHRMHRSARGQTAFEPPPYVDGSSLGEAAPSFDQATRQVSARTAVSETRSASRANSLTIPRVDQQGRHGIAPTSNGHPGDQTSDHHHPPAYGTSPHPPSYDAQLS